MMEECRTCKYFLRRMDNLVGACKRHAPQSELLITTHKNYSEFEPEGVWPKVRAEDWCGDYERKE